MLTRRVVPRGEVCRLCWFALAVMMLPFAVCAQRQMERLGRGVVAVRSSSTQAYIGWRWLGNDPEDIAFNLYRVAGGATNKLNALPITNRTDFVDTPNFAVANTYFVRPVLGGSEVPDLWAHPLSPGAFTIPANPPAVPVDFQNKVAPFLNIPLQVPPGGTTPDGTNYTYSPNDCSIGDLDGDGEYEIIVKWDPSNSKDNSQSGYTGNVLLDAYRLDGTFLWRIDLGINIRAGAHYTQFMVYDLDGDGRAEIACKTAPGTKDGLGNWVLLPGHSPTADYRNSSGYILTGPEYLTLFDGLTGAALVTTNYVPARGTVSSWGDSYGNRVDRFLAAVAYLDGVRPSLVMCRGYYTRSVLAAWDWRNGQLTQRWVFDSNNPGNSAYAGQGNHNLSVADVDGDGKDEIIYGACTIDDNGTGLYTTGLGHGDALHVSDMDPDRPGLEVWGVHENPSYAGGGSFRDARTGQVIWPIEGTGDTGRGLAAPIDAAHPGYQMWSSVTAGTLNRFGTYISGSKPAINFATWWDADWQREIFDNAGSGGAATKLDKWTGNGVVRILSPYSLGAANINGTKSNPNLQADLLGDWREELLIRHSDNNRLMLFVPVTPATNRFRTLLHDPTYRLAIAWQNVAYNQPPHPGFYIGAGMNEPPVPLLTDASRAWRGGTGGNVWDSTTANWLVHNLWTNTVITNFTPGQAVLFDLRGSTNPIVTLVGALAPAAVKVHSPLPFTLTGNGSLTGTMGLTKAGIGNLTLATTNHFTGPTDVSEGGLIVNGALLGSPVRVRPGVWLNSRLSGHGVLGQGATLLRHSLLAPGNGTNSPGTLTLSNALALNGPVQLHFDLSDDPTGTVKTNDRVRVFGNVSLTGTNELHLTALHGELASGSYALIEYTGTLTGNTNHLRLSPLWTNGASLVFSPGVIALVVPTNAAPPGVQNLTWRGGNNTNAWDNGVSFNWHNGTNATPFNAGDAVTFDNTGATNPTVNLFGSLAPGVLRVNSASNYTITGSGSLTGTNALLKSGPGTLTLTTVNTFSGGTRLTNGILALSGPAPGGITANNYALGAGPVTFYGGTLQMYGYGLGDNTSTFGALTNELIIPTGQTGTLRTGPRQTVSSRVTGGGTFHLRVEYVRGEITGDWTGFTGALVVSNTTGTPPSSTDDDFRVGNASGFPAARVHLGPNVAMYNRAAAGSVIPFGELSAQPGAKIVAGGGSGLGAQNAVTWRVGALNTSATNAASISGATSLIKEGAGTWTLTGTNSHTGSNHVAAGMLVINGDHSAAAGPVTVGLAGTLAGTGSIGGPATIAGRLAPGAPGFGTITFLGNLTLSPAALTQLEISKEPFAHDAVAVGGTLQAAGTLEVIHLSPDPLVAGDNFPLFSVGNFTGSFANYNLPPLDEGLAWNLTQLPINGRLWVVTTNPPAFTGLQPGAGQLTLHGAGGTPGWEFHVLAATNAAAPLVEWTAIATNQFDPLGQFSVLLPLTNDPPHRFFRVRVP